MEEVRQCWAAVQAGPGDKWKRLRSWARQRGTRAGVPCHALSETKQVSLTLVRCACVSWKAQWTDYSTVRFEQAEKLRKRAVKIRQKTARQKGHMVSTFHRYPHDSNQSVILYVSNPFSTASVCWGAERYSWRSWPWEKTQQTAQRHLMSWVSCTTFRTTWSKANMSKVAWTLAETPSTYL